MTRTHWQLAAVGVLGAVAACVADDRGVGPKASAPVSALTSQGVGSGGFVFEPLAASAVCTNGGSATQPFLIPAGFEQSIIASEPDVQNAIDMNTQNETGVQAGRYLYRVSEVSSNGSLAVTDLWTGETRKIAQRADWESLDPIVWTPWGSLLIAEEIALLRVIQDVRIGQRTR